MFALHPLVNGGGVGIGKAINGGFGLVLDGSSRVDDIIRSAMLWDVMGGVARRSWARNPHSMETVTEFNLEQQGRAYITLPNLAEDSLIDSLISTN